MTGDSFTSEASTVLRVPAAPRSGTLEAAPPTPAATRGTVRGPAGGGLVVRTISRLSDKCHESDRVFRFHFIVARHLSPDQAAVAMTDASPSARRARPRDPGRGRAVRAPAATFSSVGHH